MQKRWVLKSQGDLKTVSELASALSVDPAIANLLVQRDIKTFDEARAFFRPSLDMLHDPYLMKDMDKAVARIEQALVDHERILVYGDYDVDGTTSVALVYSYLSRTYDKLGYYIPDRYKEGYGVSTMGIDFAHQEGYSLIIALDCGIKANEKVAYANSLGIDFIICDHHLPGNELPDAKAVLDPKRDDCPYPFKELSGCGIGFKLVQALELHRDGIFENITGLLDLVAISTAADIVPIIGENRILTFHGIQEINKNPRPGIKAILDLSNVKKELSVMDLVFIIGPRINAAGRIASASHAVALLLASSHDEAFEGGQFINEQNDTRRDLDQSITQQALAMIEGNPELISRRSTVLFEPSWHKGVIGIVASRIQEHYYKPTIILTESNGKITGSARSVKNFDLYSAIEQCSGYLEQFGGHMYAAGLTLEKENLPLFIDAFESAVATSITPEQLTPEIEIDSILEFSQINHKFARIIQKFGPFGPGNMAPVFCTPRVVADLPSRIVGTDHLKIYVHQKAASKPAFDAIAFRQGHHQLMVDKDSPFDICFTTEENHWNGNVTVQLNIKDIKQDFQKN
jgi:single-stranded-DNA-specific exonuclease